MLEKSYSKQDNTVKPVYSKRLLLRELMYTIENTRKRWRQHYDKTEKETSRWTSTKQRTWPDSVRTSSKSWGKDEIDKARNGLRDGHNLDDGTRQFELYIDKRRKKRRHDAKADRKRERSQQYWLLSLFLSFLTGLGLRPVDHTYVPLDAHITIIRKAGPAGYIRYKTV